MPTTEVIVDIIYETERAYQIDDDTWIPKSQVEDMVHIKGQTHNLTIPEWLAKDKGLV